MYRLPGFLGFPDIYGAVYITNLFAKLGNNRR
jgi:hypothetical protein